MPRRAKATSGRAVPAKYKQQTLPSHFSSSPPPPTIRKVSTASSQKTRIKGTKRVQESDSDAEVVESPVRRPVRRMRQQAQHSEGESDSSDVGKIKFENQSSTAQSNASGSSSSEAEPLSPNRPSKRQRVLNSESEEDEDVDNHTSKRPSRRLVKREVQDRSESESEAPHRSRLVKGKRPSSEGEEEDMMDGIDEHKIIKSRLRDQPSRKSKYLLNLEKLKKKKMRLADSESEEEGTANDDVIPGARFDGDEGGEENSESDVEETEEDVEDFIVEDEGDAQTTALPAIFSMNTHQDLIHHFKIVCQYLVHIAVTTPAARSRIAERLTSDEYFSVPLSITRRKLADLRDSLASSVWRPAYKKALLTYPEFDLHVLDFAVPHCDACHLGGRLSKYVGRLGGDPYSCKTFESKAPDPGSSGNDSDEERERSPPEFNLGRFCAQRTEIYHELCHWEYQVFVNLSREVEELSNSGRAFVKIAYSGGVEPPEDISDADQVMEWLDQRGIINVEWLRIKQLMSRATNLEADVKRGKGDD